MSTSENTKGRSKEEILKARIKTRRQGRIIIFWFLSIILFVSMLFINFSVVRIVSDSIELESYSTGKCETFILPPNTEVLLKTGGEYTQLYETKVYIAHWEALIVELPKHGSYSFTTDSVGKYQIDVRGRSGTFKYSVYYANYYSISHVFLISTGIFVFMMTGLFCVLIREEKNQKKEADFKKKVSP